MSIALGDGQLREDPLCPQPMMDWIPIGLAHLAAHLPRRRVGCYALLAHQCGELLAPLPQRVLADVEALARLELVLALDHQMHMRVRLVRVQHHGIAILQREVLARKDACGSQHLLRRRAGGHGQDDVVDQLRTRVLLPLGGFRLVLTPAKLELPVSHDCWRRPETEPVL
ncbi:hypothetical protein D9M72_576140 [compost metagenome]